VKQKTDLEVRRQKKLEKETKIRNAFAEARSEERAQFVPRTKKRELGPRFSDFILLYGRMWSGFTKDERHEITDYLRIAVRAPEFSFKGRTLGSLRKLSFQWHRGTYGRNIHEHRTWDARLPGWQQRVKKDLIVAVELTTNIDMAEEGNAQHHCVFLYCNRCESGQMAIVSLRWNPSGYKAQKRITVEVWPSNRTIVQIRGSCNRMASDDEMDVVRRWAGDLGLTVGR
jgi:hypothetical protein